jgi:hypothetical protein
MPEDGPQKKDSGGYDVVMVAGRTDDGEGAQVVRARPGRVEAGEVRPIKEGRPLSAGEVVRLEPRQDAPALYDVHVEHVVKPTDAKTAHNGPAQVATEEYRTSWERTFGPPSKQLN